MSSPCPSPRLRRLLRALLAGLWLCAAAAYSQQPQQPQRELRVCADPDNLPYSHSNLSGFENRIAELVAAELGARLTYEWLPQVRGYVRKTMGEGLCDLFIGVPSGFERVLPTRPYYRSTYVFVHRAGEPDAVQSFESARLGQALIGVQLIGDDLAATPPGHVLAARGAIANVRGYTVLGDGPAAGRMLRDLDERRLDAAVIWGPQAGYFARRSKTPMMLVPAQAPPAMPELPFEFSMSMGVRRGDKALLGELNAIIERRRADIDAILDEFGVPRVGVPRVELRSSARAP